LLNQLLNRRRKADIGDTIEFVMVDGTSQYWPHVGHHAAVVAVEKILTAHRPSKSGRAVYTVECECGVTLHPRSDTFETVR
jgi:hypothetical protein